MAVETPNVTEALGIFQVDGQASSVTLISGAGFLPSGVYNKVGDYSIFLEVPKANKLGFISSAANHAMLTIRPVLDDLRQFDIATFDGTESVELVVFSVRVDNIPVTS